jgi:glycolate oxidase
MDIPFKSVELDVMRGIKNVFDPSGILNPGKIF